MKLENKSVYLLLLTIIVPAIILAYFSLSTVKSQRALMDRELSRRSYAIAMGIREQVEKVLGEIESQIESNILPLISSKPDYEQIIKEARGLPVNQILILARDYSLIYPDVPWVKKGELGYKEAELSKEFVSKFTGVEMKEIKGAIEEAISEYIKLRTGSSSDRETAVILNAIARSYGKIDKQDEAIAVYGEIYINFPREKSVNDISLGAVAYLQRAGISLEKHKIREAIDFYTSLLKDILSGGLKCTKDEVLFYKETVRNAIHNLNRKQLVKDGELTLYNNLIRRLDNTMISQELAGRLKEKDLLKEAGFQNYAYIELDNKTLLGYKAISDKTKNVLVYFPDSDRLKGNIVVNIKQAFRYTEDFDYEITDSNNRIFLTSLTVRLVNPIIRESLTGRIPGWQIGVRAKESEALRRNAQLRMYISMGIIVLLLVIIGISIYYMFKMIHRERELSGMKTDFVSSVSHEMRTPLTTIRMIGEMFQMNMVKDKAMAKEYHDTLSGETERLSRLINKVLDFSRMDSGRKRYNLAREDIGHIIASTVKGFEKYAQVQGYAIKLDIQQNLPGIKVDADAISQVILNLLDNAVKYSPVNKDIKVNVYKKGASIIVEVIDRGIGIEPNKIDRIFERFYRAEDELTRKTKGTGVGLAIVKHIVEAHKGRIEVRSQKNEGTTFTVILPIS